MKGMITMRNTKFSNRVKATVMSLVIAATCVPVFSASAVSVADVTVSQKTANKSLSVGDAVTLYTADYATSGMKTISITIVPDFSGNFSFGLGVGTATSPYWYEWDGNNEEWVDTKGGTVEVEGTSVAVTAGKETTITIDVSSLDLSYNASSSQYPGKMEFRNYYGGDITISSVKYN